MRNVLISSRMMKTWFSGYRVRTKSGWRENDESRCTAVRRHFDQHRGGAVQRNGADVARQALQLDVFVRRPRRGRGHVGLHRCWVGSFSTTPYPAYCGYHLVLTVGPEVSSIRGIHCIVLHGSRGYRFGIPYFRHHHFIVTMSLTRTWFQIGKSDTDRIPAGAEHFGFPRPSAHHVPRTADDHHRRRWSSDVQTGVTPGLQPHIGHFRHQCHRKRSLHRQKRPAHRSFWVSREFISKGWNKTKSYEHHRKWTPRTAQWNPSSLFLQLPHWWRDIPVTGPSQRRWGIGGAFQRLQDPRVQFPRLRSHREIVQRRMPTGNPIARVRTRWVSLIRSGFRLWTMQVFCNSNAPGRGPGQSYGRKKRDVSEPFALNRPSWQSLSSSSSTVKPIDENEEELVMEMLRVSRRESGFLMKLIERVLARKFDLSFFSPSILVQYQ